MRNRVAHNDVHRGLTAARVALLGLLPTVLGLVAATAAAADTSGNVNAERWSEGLAGPVGIVAVALGVGGLLVGLIRWRRTMAARTAIAETRPMSPIPSERAHSDTAA